MTIVGVAPGSRIDSGDDDFGCRSTLLSSKVNRRDEDEGLDAVYVFGVENVSLFADEERVCA